MIKIRPPVINFKMFNSATHLPHPDATALAHSNQLVQFIKREISQQKGVMSFARFMELALYAPGLGYYSAGARKIGAAGDFVTAPEISPLFSQALAQQCRQVLAELQGGDILEFGAGSGVMAADILLELEHLNCLPSRYFILEISAELQQRQRQHLKTMIPHLFERIVWLTTLPVEPLQGVILANEVLDAMPVHRFIIENNAASELGVAWENERFIFNKCAIAQPELWRAIAQLRQNELSETPFYASEINLLSTAWLRSVSEKLQQGLILLIDYGFTRSEFYHPDRNGGTLMCHYRHHAHTDPFWYPGLQDMTAHVDFTALAQAAWETDLTLSGYATQAAFLLSCGLLTMAERFAKQNPVEQLAISRQIQKLTATHEMGELFKVLALTKKVNLQLTGFALQDWRSRL